MAQILIRQHDESRKKLFDIVNFLDDIDQFFLIARWEINVDWCLTRHGEHIGETQIKPGTYTDAEFRKLYAQVFQTIDGEFILHADQSVVATLTAVDSAFWQIDSDNQAFVAWMERKYGVYESARRAD